MSFNDSTYFYNLIKGRWTYDEIKKNLKYIRKYLRSSAVIIYYCEI